MKNEEENQFEFKVMLYKWKQHTNNFPLPYCVENSF